MLAYQVEYGGQKNKLEKSGLLQIKQFTVLLRQ